MYNWSVATLNKKQKNIDERFTENIYFRKKPESIREIIIRLLWNMEETYYDISELKLHCGKNRFRTIRDCYLLSRTYFPGVSYSFVHKTVKEIMEEAKKINKHNSFWLDWPFNMCSVAGAATFRYATRTTPPKY